MFQRKIPMIFVLFSMWLLMFLTACGQNQEIQGADSPTEIFGENCISGQTFEALSETISGEAEQLTILEIRNFLKDTNGKFDSYQEAYEVVSRLSALESSAEIAYNLIDFDGDDVPELVTGCRGYYTSLYTYSDGTEYTLMDRWGYGAMGNHRYEYVPGKNSLRNYDTDYAGAILYTTYMRISEQHSMEIAAQIVTYNFDDLNGNGVPDENEPEGGYSTGYIDGEEVSAEECYFYDAGVYEEMEVTMNLDELEARLKDKQAADGEEK